MLLTPYRGYWLARKIKLTLSVCCDCNYLVHIRCGRIHKSSVTIMLCKTDLINITSVSLVRQVNKCNSYDLEQYCSEFK